MVCEDIAKALVKAISAQGLREILAAASSQARARVVSRREEALSGPMVEEGQPDPGSDKTTHEHRLADEAVVKSVDIDFASYEEH